MIPILEFHPLEILARTILGFTALLLITRILTRQAISPMSSFDVVARITLGSMTGAISFNRQLSVLDSLLSLFAFALLTFVVSYIALKNRTIRKLLAGDAIVVIQNGQILEKNMGTVRYSLDFLMEQLREKGVFDLSEVEYAIIEHDGNLSIRKKSQHRPVTPKDLGIPTEYEGISSLLMIEGKIIHGNLKRNHLDESWLKDQLQALELSLEDVNLALLQTDGTLYIDRFKEPSGYAP